MKSFVLYRRVSTARQGVSGLGLESQDEAVRRYVAQQNGMVVGEFVEVESGKKTDTDRPQLALALVECRRRKATLVVAKLDRLSRNAEFLLRLQNGNVDFVCCDCPNVDRFTVGILALVAQRERELISERTKSALQQAKKRGVRLGTKNPDRQVRMMLEGARRDRQEFVSKVRPIIDEIKQSGVVTLKEIALCLTRRGIPTRTGKSVWFGSSVKSVIG
jgi:DNA invertase Pin-like site-specific DNA recombinase